MLQGTSKASAGVPVGGHGSEKELGREWTQVGCRATVNDERIAMRNRSLSLTAVALSAGIALADYSTDSTPSTLHDPSTQGVEALRKAMRSALLNHSAKEQCELFAPNLLDAAGGTVTTCTKLLARVEGEPSAHPNAYNTSPSAYVAGEQIEMAGNIAVYGNGEPVFKAAYTEGAWKIVDKELDKEH